jgi:probable rRNA maturation factor
MIDVEVFAASGARAPAPAELQRLCVMVAEHLGVQDGHVAVELVDARRIAELNGEHRGKPQPTDVLSFPIDGIPETPLEAGGHGERSATVPLELGDIVICPEHTVDVREAVVHGMLHLLGMDHETDGGEMLELQRELLAHAER